MKSLAFLAILGAITLGSLVLKKDSVNPKTQVANVVSATQSGTSSSTPTTTTPPSNAEATTSAKYLESLIDSKLDSYVKQGKFRGPKGDRGDKGDRGQDGKPGQNGSSGISTSYTTPTGVTAPIQNLTVSYTPPGASNPGSIGAITYLSSREHLTDKLTVSDTANVTNLNVTGQTSFSSLLPQTNGSVVSGVVTTEVVSGLSYFFIDSQKLIALDGDGLVNFLYINSAGTELHLVKCTDINCTTKIDTVIATGDIGYNQVLIFGSDGFARISYFDDSTTPHELYFIRCTNSTCSTKVSTLVDISDSMGLVNYYSVGIALNSNDIASIVYDNYDGTSALRLATCNDLDCTAPTLTTLATSGNYLEAVSIAVAEDGFARIAYNDYSTTPDELHFIQCTNATCSTKNDSIVDTGTGYYELEMVLGDDGFGRIVYKTTDDGIKFAKCTNISCSSSSITVIDTVLNANNVSLAIDNRGFPKITYSISFEGNYYVSCSNAGCSEKSKKKISSQSYYLSSMVIGPDGFARILHNNNLGSVIYLARLTSDDGFSIISGSSMGGSGNAFGNIFGTRINADELYLDGSLLDPSSISQWISTTSNNIYYDLGNVGIGTSTPQTKLAVVGGSFSVGSNWINRDTAGGFQVINRDNSMSESIVHAQGAILGIYANPQAYAFLGTSGISYPAQSSGIISQTGNPLVLGANGVEAMRIETNGGVGIGYKRSYSFTRSIGENAGDTVNIGSLSGVGNGQIYFTLYLSGGSCNGLGQANAKYEFISQYDINTGGWQELAPFQSTKTLTRNFVAVDVNHPGGFGPIQVRIRQTINPGTNCASHIGHLEVYNESANFTPSTSTGTGGTVNGQYTLNPITQINGLVGIATTSPWRKFSITGTVALDGLTAGAGAGTLCLSANKEVTYSAGATCTVSSGRFKHDIATSTTGLDFVNKLRPVTFKYNEDIGVPGEQFGFIAEEVEQLDPRLVVHDKEGLPFSVRYENLTATLVKAIQEQNIEIQDLKLKFGTTTTASSTVIIHDTSGVLSYLTEKLIDGVLYLKEIVVEKVTATIGVFKEVETSSICLSDANGNKTCIDKSKLDAILLDSGASQGDSASVLPTNYEPSNSTENEGNVEGYYATSSPVSNPIEEVVSNGGESIEEAIESFTGQSPEAVDELD